MKSQNGLSNEYLNRPPHRGSLRQRLFAWMIDRQGDQYEDFSGLRKRTLFGSLHGLLLELGPGKGNNLRYYPADIRWIGVEPNPYLYPSLLRSIRVLGRPEQNFHIDPGDPQGGRLPAGDGSVDAVVSTLVLCSVTHPEASLQEILRVLKPGGQFIFIEHVAAPRGTRMRAFQDFIQPVWTLVGDGCHPNRETWETISRAGFSRVEIEHYQYPGVGPVGPHISGRAYK